MFAVVTKWHIAFFNTDPRLEGCIAEHVLEGIDYKNLTGGPWRDGDDAPKNFDGQSSRDPKVYRTFKSKQDRIALEFDPVDRHLLGPYPSWTAYIETPVGQRAQTTSQ